MNNLRTHAETRIKEGTAPLSRWSTTGTQALSLLHRLASTPESAGDALKLLHELQVHQVELDLQREQIEENGRQLTEDLKSAAMLFELAPFAYLTLNPEGGLVAANRMARSWLAGPAGEPEPWVGRPVADLLAPESRIAIQGLLAALRKEGGQQSCAVRCRADGAQALVVANATPGVDRVLMAFDIARPGPVACT